MKSFGLTMGEFAARTPCVAAPEDLGPRLTPGAATQRIQGFPYSKGSKRKSKYASNKYFLTISTRQLSADVCEPIQWLR